MATSVRATSISVTALSSLVARRQKCKTGWGARSQQAYSVLPSVPQITVPGARDVSRRLGYIFCRIYTYSHALACSLLQLHNCTQCSNSFLCLSRAHPAPSSLGNRGREKHEAKEEAGPIRWALTGINLSPAHLPPAVGTQRAEVGLKFFFFVAAAGEARRLGRGKRWKGKENAFHAI